MLALNPFYLAICASLILVFLVIVVHFENKQKKKAQEEQQIKEQTEAADIKREIKRKQDELDFSNIPFDFVSCGVGVFRKSAISSIHTSGIDGSTRIIVDGQLFSTAVPAQELIDKLIGIRGHNK